MKILAILILGIIIISWVYNKYYRKRTQPIQPNNTQQEFSLPAGIEASNNSDGYDTGPVTQTHDGGWVLNPKSTFPLTFYDIDKPTAKELKELLDGGYTQGTDDPARRLVLFIDKKRLRCKEIDEYIKEFKPKYYNKIEEMKSNSKEWALASEKDREDLLIDFRTCAIEALDVKPYCDLEALFEYESSRLRYIEQVAFLICHTYIMAGYGVKSIFKDPDVMPIVTGWELSNIEDAATCPYCRRAAIKSYSKINCPKVPLHIGCRCSIIPKLKY